MRDALGRNTIARGGQIRGERVQAEPPGSRDGGAGHGQVLVHRVPRRGRPHAEREGAPRAGGDIRHGPGAGAAGRARDEWKGAAVRPAAEAFLSRAHRGLPTGACSRAQDREACRGDRGAPPHGTRGVWDLRADGDRRLSRGALDPRASRGGRTVPRLLELWPNLSNDVRYALLRLALAAQHRRE